MSRDLIQISDRDFEVLSKILNKYSENFTFFVFGSRVKNKAKQYSDIDIAYEALSNSSITRLRDDLESSALSITVDLVNLHDVDLDFQKLIRSEMISFF